MAPMLPAPLGTRMNFLTASEIGMRRGGENPADMSLPKFRADEKPIIPPETLSFLIRN